VTGGDEGMDWLIARPTLTTADCLHECDRAISEGAQTLIVHPVHARALVEHARARIEIEALVAYPFGASKPVIKAIEATNSVKDGVTGVVVVVNPAQVVRQNADCLLYTSPSPRDRG
jgi:deoxyribose-phosphate aldolase